MQTNIPKSKGTLTDTTEVVNMESASIPATITLGFASLTTQKIEISTDSGTSFKEVSYAINDATQKVLTIGAPVSNVRFTGVAGDTWSIR